MLNNNFELKIKFTNKSKIFSRLKFKVQVENSIHELKWNFEWKSSYVCKRNVESIKWIRC